VTKAASAENAPPLGGDESRKARERKEGDGEGETHGARGS
jgi:hypothetical protein